MNLPDLLQINIPFIIVLLLAGVGALLSYLQYRRTLPEIRQAWRFILAVLRGLVVFLVLATFLRPELTIYYHRQKEKKIAVFVDRSQSMEIVDDSLPRWQRERLIVDKFKDALKTPHWFAFHSKVFPGDPDSLRPTLFATNLQRVVQKIDILEPDAAVLISDGNYTEGIYPVTDRWEADTPLFTIGLGNRFAEPDLFLQDIIYEPVAYEGKPQKIIARIGARSVKKKIKSALHLIVDGKMLKTVPLQLQPQGALKEVVFNYTPRRSGEVRLDVSLDSFPGEKNKSNNRQSHLQKVLKDKIKVVILSGAVDYESKFLKLLLNAQEDVDCDLFVRTKGRRWVGGKNPQFNYCDVLILSNYPGDYSTPAELTKIQRQIQESRCGLLFVTGKYVNSALLHSFAKYLPFDKFTRLSQALPTLQISAQPDAAILQLFDDQNTVQQFWQKVPPLAIFATGKALKKDAQVLLTGLTRRGNIPLVILEQMQRGQRSALLNGSGFWKWQFLLQDSPQISGGYANLLHRLVRWLSEKQKIQQVVLQSSEKIHFLGRPVHLTVHLFDAAYKPVSDGRVKLEVKSKKQNFSVDAAAMQDTTDSSGVYRASFVPPAQGKYTVFAEGFRNNLFLGKDRLSFNVIPFQKELLDTRQNSRLLQEMARISGGRYFTENGVDSLVRILNVEPQIVSVKKSVILWNSFYLLLSILGLVVMEWAIRKFKGLA